MFHPYIAKGIRYLLIASGTLFAFLVGVTIVGIVLIIANGGTV